MTRASDDGSSVLPALGGLAAVQLPTLVFGLAAAGVPLPWLGEAYASEFAVFGMPLAALWFVAWPPVVCLLLAWLTGRARVVAFAALPLVLTRALPFLHLLVWGTGVADGVRGADVGGLVLLGAMGALLGWLALVAFDAVTVTLASAFGMLKLVRDDGFVRARAMKRAGLSVAMAAMLVLLVIAPVALYGALPGGPAEGSVDLGVALVGLVLPAPLFVLAVAASRERLAVPLGLAGAAVLPLATLAFVAQFATLRDVLVTLSIASVLGLSGLSWGLVIGVTGFTAGWLWRGRPALEG
ncbi:MAG: hypothetical protein EP330_01175 [Deltaproteobacteria bacterium]|nr:MAG: hypothetical protein EP330_01175 [Deltaproteobacteria bacterium]